jgi:hypothetical protein
MLKLVQSMALDKGLLLLNVFYSVCVLFAHMAPLDVVVVHELFHAAAAMNLQGSTGANRSLLAWMDIFQADVKRGALQASTGLSENKIN